MGTIRVKLHELLNCLSGAQDLADPRLSNHHQQVAYLSYRFAEHLGLKNGEKNDIFSAALIHDVGALSKKERLELIEDEPVDVNSHGFRGAKLFKDFKPLKKASEIVRYHHVPWNGGEGQLFGGELVPFSSHIVHIADRVCAQIRPKRDILSQVSSIVGSIEQRNGTVFEPSLVEAFKELAKKEFIWFDLQSPLPMRRVEFEGNRMLHLGISDLLEFAHIISQIIDFRSGFTARHSAGVAKTAAEVARLMRFSKKDVKLIEIAGYLHDLGKLAIDNGIIEKKGSLTESEFNEIKRHPYYTHVFLSAVKGLKKIDKWASFHHEKMNGDGYPFSAGGRDLPLGSRIVAVADVFTALTEMRPYSEGMDKENAVRALREMAASGALDAAVVDVLIKNIDHINEIRFASQQEAVIRYREFFKEEAQAAD
jgi:HD-GYP domain-containing protein (c-di-GMP phosphodiesterase class II)